MERIRQSHPQTENPNQIKGLTPYQILGKPTEPNKERKKDMKIGGRKVHNSFCREVPMVNRALQGHSGKNLDISTFSAPYWILKK